MFFFLGKQTFTIKLLSALIIIIGGEGGEEVGGEVFHLEHV